MLHKITLFKIKGKKIDTYYTCEMLVLSSVCLFLSLTRHLCYNNKALFKRKIFLSVTVTSNKM